MLGQQPLSLKIFPGEASERILIRDERQRRKNSKSKPAAPALDDVDKIFDTFATYLHNFEAGLVGLLLVVECGHDFFVGGADFVVAGFEECLIELGFEGEGFLAEAEAIGYVVDECGVVVEEGTIDEVS